MSRRPPIHPVHPAPGRCGAVAGKAVTIHQQGHGHLFKHHVCAFLFSRRSCVVCLLQFRKMRFLGILVSVAAVLNVALALTSSQLAEEFTKVPQCAVSSPFVLRSDNILTHPYSKNVVSKR